MKKKEQQQPPAQQKPLSLEEQVETLSKRVAELEAKVKRIDSRTGHLIRVR
jgi:chaperonin cofactor prefoldin